MRTRLMLGWGCGSLLGDGRQEIRDGCARSPRPAGIARYAAAEMVVADACHSGGGWLEVADVIVCTAGTGTARGSRPAWLPVILARYPGCAVAAAADASGCTALTRPGAVLGFGAAGCPPGMWVLVCGCLVHCWAAAGWPVAGLDGARLRVTAGGPALGRPGWRVRGQLAGAPLSFSAAWTPAGPGPSASSARRAPAASGAPI